MAVLLAGCRKALVGTGWAISLLCCTNRYRKHSSCLIGAPFIALQAVFSQDELSLVGEL